MHLAAHALACEQASSWQELQQQQSLVKRGRLVQAAQCIVLGMCLDEGTGTHQQQQQQ
jgi:hypothetical protein